MPEPRKYALTRVGPGDYLCPSNDALVLWRFQRYEDGSYYGLVDVDYEARPFWRAVHTHMPEGSRLDLDEIDFLTWHEAAGMLPDPQGGHRLRLRRLIASR